MSPEHDFGYFDAAEAMKEYERGRRFGMDSMTFFRLAEGRTTLVGWALRRVSSRSCLMPCPVARLSLWGNRHMFSIFRAGARRDSLDEHRRKRRKISRADSFNDGRK